MVYIYYLRNLGKEVINVNYCLRIIDSYKNVDKVIMVRYI